MCAFLSGNCVYHTDKHKPLPIGKHRARIRSNRERRVVRPQRGDLFSSEFGPILGRHAASSHIRHVLKLCLQAFRQVELLLSN